MSSTGPSINQPQEPSQPSIQPSPAPSDDDSLQTGIDHASTGYKNAQEIIRFMDTKSGVIAGFVFVGIGCILEAGKELIVSDKGSQLLTACPLGTWLVCLIAMCSVGFGVWSVYCAVMCISPRAPSTKFYQNDPPRKLTILFPFFNDADANEEKEAKQYYGRIVRQDGVLTAYDIAEEYRSQILNVGAILYKKISWNKRAARALLVQLALLALVIFLTLLGFLLKTIPLA